MTSNTYVSLDAPYAFLAPHLINLKDVDLEYCTWLEHRTSQPSSTPKTFTLKYSYFGDYRKTSDGTLYPVIIDEEKELEHELCVQMAYKEGCLELEEIRRRYESGESFRVDSMEQSKAAMRRVCRQMDQELLSAVFSEVKPRNALTVENALYETCNLPFDVESIVMSRMQFLRLTNLNPQGLEINQRIDFSSSEPGVRGYFLGSKIYVHGFSPMFKNAVFAFGPKEHVGYMPMTSAEFEPCALPEASPESEPINDGLVMYKQTMRFGIHLMGAKSVAVIKTDPEREYR